MKIEDLKNLLSNRAWTNSKSTDKLLVMVSGLDSIKDEIDSVEELEITWAQIDDELLPCLKIKGLKLK